MSTVIVIGSGIAGLSAALMAADRGHRVTVVTKGYGGTLLSPGTLDVLGYNDQDQPVDAPFTTLASVAETHPYAAIGVEAVRNGLQWLIDGPARPLNYQLSDETIYVPTAIGAARPTTAVPGALRHSVLRPGGRYVVVGLDAYKDLPAQLAADNLTRNPYVDVSARAITVELPARTNEHDATATTLARLIDDDPELLVRALGDRISTDEVALVPPILGLQPATAELVENLYGQPIGELLAPPPAIGGRRLHDLLVQSCREARVDIQLNAVAVGGDFDGERLTALKVRRAGRVTTERVDAVVHAAGGFESGGLSRDSAGHIKESVFDLPVVTGDGTPDVELTSTTAVLSSGVLVNGQMQPVDAAGRVVATNIHLTGDILGGALPSHEKSGEGIALGSAWAAVTALSNAEGVK